MQINIRIGNRQYPMRVSADAESMLRHSAEELNNAMGACKKRYRDADAQDLLAIVAFDQWVAQARQKIRMKAHQKKISDYFAQMQTALSQALKGSPHDAILNNENAAKEQKDS